MRILYRIYKIHHEEKRGVFGFFFRRGHGVLRCGHLFPIFYHFFLFSECPSSSNMSVRSMPLFWGVENNMRWVVGGGGRREVI